MVGIYLSEKKSEQFPWGLYKIENMITVLSSGLIFLAGFEIAGIIVTTPVELKNLDIGLVSVFLMAVPNLFFYKYESRIAKAVNSPSLKADAENWKMDTLSLAVVGVGIAASRFLYHVMDRIAAVVVLAIIIKAGYEIIRDSMKSLLDASVDRHTINRIAEIIKGFKQVQEVVDLNARSSGRYIFVRAIVAVSERRLKEAHEVADAIEKEIKENVPFIERVIIHYEPERKDSLRYAAPLANGEGKLSEHFGTAPYIAIWNRRLADKAVLSQEIIENPFKEIDKGKGVNLAELLVRKGVDVLYIKKTFDGKGPAYVFSDAGIEIRMTESATLQGLIMKEG